jgi:hypothetical protein
LAPLFLFIFCKGGGGGAAYCLHPKANPFEMQHNTTHTHEAFVKREISESERERRRDETNTIFFLTRDSNDNDNDNDALLVIRGGVAFCFVFSSSFCRC